MANEPKRRGRPKKVTEITKELVTKALESPHPAIRKPVTVIAPVEALSWVTKIESFCNKEGITPEELIEVYKKKKPSIKDILNEKVSTASDYMTQRRRAKGLIL